MSMSQGLVILLTLLSPLASSIPTLCTPGTRIYIKGTDIIQQNRGFLLLLVYMPLQCSHCHRQLRELSLLAESVSELRVVVIAPGFEAPSFVDKLRREFKHLSLDRDEDGLFVSTGHQPHDITLYDRCGRVSHILPHRQDYVTSYRIILNVVEEALKQAKCGWCQYDSRGSRDLSKHNQEFRAKSINAYFKPSSSYGQQRDDSIYQRQTTPSYQQQQQIWLRQREQQARYPQQPYASYQTTYPPSNQQDRTQQHYQHNYQHQTAHSYPSDRSRSPYPSNTQHSYNQQQSNQHHQQQQLNQNQRNPSTYYNHLIHPTIPTTPETTKNPYGPDEDYEDLVSKAPTTPKVQTQIPQPTSPWFPTLVTPHVATGIKNYQINKPFGPIVSENNIPCSAYTDDICFQQQEKLGRYGLSKCCSKGIYITDVCIPGKCTNSTVQLCCFQKFLQSKYSCCEDSGQSEGTTSTNKFNRCCYDKFIDDDPCCTKESAAQYWPSVHELCYPNTNVDYSSVKMEVRFAEGLRVIDLNENRLWDHECRYGGNRIQYAYLP
ncbi:unnamed protein product [Auanema sp. JU1783]|nr:unnamed protein product [Auanema sp. JU1783]